MPLQEPLTAEEQTRNTLRNHLQAAGQGDLDAVVADYTEDAVLMTPDGLHRGKAEIRAFFERFLPDLPAPPALVVEQQHVAGDVAYLVWSGESEALRIPFATDTLVVRDGEIAAQTFAAQVEAKTTA
jgi:ketosteroid isomerase-like protein